MSMAAMNAASVREPAPLEVRIHRGAHEIGGNCVELRHGQDTLILDIGKPLTAAWGEVVPLPAAIGLGDIGTRPLGVIISHGHQDHWGLAPQLPTDIPVYIGEGAANILRAAQFWGSGVDLHEAGHLHDQVPFTLGPFTITPYLADHSAYDAFSLLIEAARALPAINRRYGVRREALLLVGDDELVARLDAAFAVVSTYY